MGSLDNKVAWITGAGSGIGEAAALALADAGAAVVLTGRRAAPLEALAARVERSGGIAMVAPGDVGAPPTAGAIAEAIQARFGRLDILVNNAGSNITARRWDQLTPEGIDSVVHGNLSSAFYCAVAAMALMRPNRDGVLIHTASWAGKFISTLSGATYTAAKHAVVAMSQTINIEEYANGIRSTAILPAEVATPILDTRPKPPSPEERARMLQPGDLAELILFIATRPASVCLNEVVISPTANRLYGMWTPPVKGCGMISPLPCGEGQGVRVARCKIMAPNRCRPPRVTVRVRCAVPRRRPRRDCGGICVGSCRLPEHISGAKSPSVPTSSTSPV